MRTSLSLIPCAVLLSVPGLGACTDHAEFSPVAQRTAVESVEGIWESDDGRFRLRICERDDDIGCDITCQIRPNAETDLECVDAKPDRGCAFSCDPDVVVGAAVRVEFQRGFAVDEIDAIAVFGAVGQAALDSPGMRPRTIDTPKPENHLVLFGAPPILHATLLPVSSDLVIRDLDGGARFGGTGDASVGSEGGAPSDGGVAMDGGENFDGGAIPDGGVRSDAGIRSDGGTTSATGMFLRRVAVGACR